jgi:hypothetical protein
MYLAQQIEEVRDNQQGYAYFGVRLLRYRVALDKTGRPVWRMDKQRGTWWNSTPYVSDTSGPLSSAKDWIRQYASHVPLMASVGPNKRVSMAEAERLTGILRPAALDYLTERVLANNENDIENYVKPKPAKKPKAAPEPKSEPTPAEVATASAERARAKVAQWERRAAHAAKKIKEWERRAKYHERRVAKLAGRVKENA